MVLEGLADPDRGARDSSSPYPVSLQPDGSSLGRVPCGVHFLLLFVAGDV